MKVLPFGHDPSKGPKSDVIVELFTERLDGPPSSSNKLPTVRQLHEMDTIPASQRAAEVWSPGLLFGA